jgi:hypothetical protein
LRLVLGSGWRSPEALPLAPLLALSSSVAARRLPGTVAAQRCLIVRRGHVPPPPRVRRGHHLLCPTCVVAVASSASLCAVAVASSASLCAVSITYRELGEELYQRERGSPSGRTCAAPVVPHRRRVMVGHAVDASEPHECVS